MGCPVIVFACCCFICLLCKAINGIIRKRNEREEAMRGRDRIEGRKGEVLCVI